MTNSELDDIILVSLLLSLAIAVIIVGVLVMKFRFFDRRGGDGRLSRRIGFLMIVLGGIFFIVLLFLTITMIIQAGS